MFVVISSIRFTLCGVGGALLLSGFVFLKCTDKDDARHNFGHSGGMVYNYLLQYIYTYIFVIFEVQFKIYYNILK